MAYYLVKFVHTDIEHWKQHVRDHAIYLYQLVESGDLLLSGPIENNDDHQKEAYLVLKADNEAQLMALLKADPFWKQGLVSDYTIEKGTPMFGNPENIYITPPTNQDN